MIHEDLKREQDVEGSSNRSFGLVFAGVFLVIALWPLMRSGAPRWWAMAPALFFMAAAFAMPDVLAPLNRWWMRLGLMLGKLVSPIALGLVFYGALTPTAWLVRLVGKDPLRLKKAPQASSYWLPREPPGPPPQSMNNQF